MSMPEHFGSTLLSWLRSWWAIPLTACVVVASSIAYAFGSPFGPEAVVLRFSVAAFGAACRIYAAKRQQAAPRGESRKRLELPDPIFKAFVLLILVRLVAASVAIPVAIALR